VPYATQKSLVGKNIVMEVTDNGDGTFSIISYHAWDPNTLLKSCKGDDCDDPCEPPDYPDGCPCDYCSDVQDVSAVAVYVNYSN